MHSDALAAGDGRADRVEVEVVRQGDDDEVDLGVGAQARPSSRRSASIAVTRREGGPALAAGRGARDDPGARHEPQPGHVVVGDEPGSDEPEADLGRHQ